LVSVLLLAFVFPTVGAAQEASPSEMAAARDLFTEGIEAARDERWEEARGLFERSYRVVPRASTLLNLAGAQAETGQLVQAAESYRRFVASAGPRERRLVSSAEEALADVESRLGRATIHIDNLEDEDEVWLDDEVIGHGSLGIALPINPGDHVVTIARGGAPAGESSFTVSEGEATEVRVTAEVTAAAPVDPMVAPDRETDDGGGILSSPWLWIGLGLVVAAAIVIPIVIVSSGSETEPYMGNLGVGTLTFE